MSARGDRSVGAVIEEFLTAAEEGRARRPDGRRYSRDEIRMLRGALSHVASDFGGRMVDDVREWQVQALVYRLRDAGLSSHRLTAVVEALRSLYAHAIARGLVARSPVVGLAPPRMRSAEPAPDWEDEAAEPAEDEDEDYERELRTPTQAVLMLADRLAVWTLRFAVSAFVVLMVGLALGIG